MSEGHDIDEYFFADEVTPEQMDFLWAHGWRHFGVYFFRYATIAKHDGLQQVMPLRIKLANFSLSASLKRVLNKNADLRLEIRAASVDATKEALFDRHKTRFVENVPDSMYDFFSPQPATTPCRTQELCLFQDEKLLAASFLDLGAQASSSVYSIYEPAEPKRSLGICLILLSIAYSIELGKEYYYPGYAYHEPSHYDYKKRFRGLEQFDWQEWQASPEIKRQKANLKR
jgi:arginine-tRNA-protein transferase